MHALVNQLAAAGQLRIGAPLPVITRAAAMSVASTNEHERSDRPGIDQFAGLLQRRMETVIITETNAHAGPGGGILHLPQLGRGETAGLFHKDVFAGAHGRKADRRERGVDRGDDDRTDYAAVSYTHLRAHET